jgi:tetratricopeptide (TPR) repeat protein
MTSGAAQRQSLCIASLRERYTVANHRAGWRLLPAACALALLCVTAELGPAAAQSPANPVVEHYRAYTAAFEAGDFEAAEGAAAAALQASQARDGEAGRTGVLALNLAMARLRLNRHADAVQPAQLALDIATRDAGAGVDRTIASLVHSRALIGTADEFRERAALERSTLAALEEAAARAPALNGYAYDTALDLARLALEMRRYRQADEAAEHALRFSSGAEVPEPVARARALVIKGAIRMYQGQARDAVGPIDEAVQLLRPFAVETDGDVLTVGQSLYVQALLWQSFVAAEIGDSIGHLEVQEAELQLTPRDGDAPLCQFSLASQANVTLPEEDWGQGSGAAVLGLRLDAQGNVVASEVLAASSDAFRQVVASVQSWRLERNPASDPGCRMQTNRYLVAMRYAVEPMRRRWPNLLSPAQLPL